MHTPVVKQLLVTLTMDKDIKDVTDLVAGRSWTIDGMRCTEAVELRLDTEHHVDSTTQQEIQPHELLIDTFKQTILGFGVVPDVAVRVIHRPTGVQAISGGERSLHANREKAIEELKNHLAGRRWQPMAETSPDANVDAVRKKLLDRSRVGLAKYGVTTERTDLGVLDWITHAQEEAMDFCVYLEALRKNIQDATKN